MKIPILVPTTNSGARKEEFLRCFGLRLRNSTKLHEVVRDLIGAGVSRQTLTLWAVEAGYAKASVSSLLSRIYSSLGLRERRKGAGRKPSSVALELLAHAHDRYGENFLKVLCAAWRAGKARSGASAVSDATSDVIVAPQLREAGANCLHTIRRRPCVAQPTRVALRESLSNETSIRTYE
jgi:hypothetical protein